MSKPHQKPRVFIGSSSEGIDIAHNLQRALQSEFEVECWDQGIFELMKGILECVQAAAEWCDFAIVVVTPDNETSGRGYTVRTPRDNVIFEAGYFVGVLGRERTFIVQCEEDKVELPTDLQGATTARYSRSSNSNLQAALNTVVLPIKDRVRRLGARNRPANGPRTFAQSESGVFTAYMEAILAKAKRVILIGTGLNILHKDRIRKDLIERAHRDRSFNLEIYLADPLSPAVESRLVEEELWRKIKPTVGRDGLLNRLNCLIDECSIDGKPSPVTLRLFRHYPTFALLIVDHEFFIYPYAYATLGNCSPVMRFEAGDPSDDTVIEFLTSHYELVKESSVDARQMQESRRGRIHDATALHAFAVYFIPSADSGLYQFGSGVLGYDVRTKECSTSPWASMTGNASQLGFHLTISDILYFPSREDVRHSIEEVRMLAKEFRPFELTKLRVKSGFPDERSVAIVLEDSHGGLEALHFEMVHRCYRRAVASNYTLGLAEFGRADLPGRREHMLRRYLASYILSAYQPHFTLMTQVAPEQMEGVSKQLKDLFADRVPHKSVVVDRLAIMELDGTSGRWAISEEISLANPGLKRF